MEPDPNVWTPEQVRSVITLIGTTIASILAAVAVVLGALNHLNIAKVDAKTDLQTDELELHTDLIEAAGGQTAASKSRIKAAKSRHVKPKPLPVARSLDDKTEI